MTKDEALRTALKQAYNLGQIYWQQADSEYISQHRKADLTEAKFKELVEATMAALEAKDEPVPVAIVEVFGKDWRLDYMALPVGKHKLYAQQYTYTTLSQRKPLTDEEIKAIEDGIWKPEFFDDTERQANCEFARAIEAAHGIKGEA